LGRHSSTVGSDEIGAQAIETTERASTSCSVCGTSLEFEERFCTACGARVFAEDSAGIEAVAAQPVGPRIALETDVSRRHWLRGRGRVLIPLGLCVLVLGAAIAALATLWRAEVRAHRHATSQLFASQANVGELEKSLERTKSSLAQAQALASKRKEVLLQANRVLKRVDPLLSSVDELQQVTSGIRTSRDTFAADSDQMVSVLIGLYNYVSQTSTDYIDWYWVSDQVNVVNGELATVRSDAATLSSYDSKYDDASTRFGLRATAYTSSVRALQGQLKDAVADK
jgi:hypothetical protein